MRHKEAGHGQYSHHEGKAHGQYENEVEKPSLPHEGHMEHGMGCHEMKAEADPIAYGQAGAKGCKSDESKIHSQFKNYDWVD